MVELRSIWPRALPAVSRNRQSVAQGAAVVSFLDRADDAGDLSPDGVELLPVRRELLPSPIIGLIPPKARRSPITKSFS